MARRLFNIGGWLVMWARVWSVDSCAFDRVDQWTIRIRKPRWAWYKRDRIEAPYPLLIERREFGWLVLRKYTSLADEGE